MLDERLVHTTQNLDTIRNCVLLTPSSEYITLQPYHKVWFSASNVSTSTGTPIPVTTEEGIYEAVFYFTTTNSTITNWDILLIPNSIIYTSVFRYSAIHRAPTATPTFAQVAASYANITTYGGFYIDTQDGTTDTLPGLAHFIISTFTTRKQVSCIVADMDGICVTNTYWDDTTTIWNKFGTIKFSFVSAISTFNMEGYIVRLL